MIRFTLAALLMQKEQAKALEIFKRRAVQILEAAVKSLSPNVKEEIKLLVVCVSILAQDEQF